MNLKLNTLHKVLVTAIVCIGLFYVCRYIQEGYSGRNRRGSRGGSRGRHHGGSRGRHHGGSRGRHHGGSHRRHYYPQRNIFYPEYYYTPDTYVYPVYDYENKNNTNFINYLRWLLGYPQTTY
jgi:hypothetical protein